MTKSETNKEWNNCTIKDEFSIYNCEQRLATKADRKIFLWKSFIHFLIIDITDLFLNHGHGSLNNIYSMGTYFNGCQTNISFPFCGLDWADFSLFRHSSGTSCNLVRGPFSSIWD